MGGVTAFGGDTVTVVVVGMVVVYTTLDPPYEPVDVDSIGGIPGVDRYPGAV